MAAAATPSDAEGTCTDEAIAANVATIEAQKVVTEVGLADAETDEAKCAAAAKLASIAADF